MAGSKDVIAGMRRERLIAHLNYVFPFQDEPCLILALVNVQRNPGRRIIGGLNQRVCSTSLLAFGNKPKPTVRRLSFFSGEVRHHPPISTLTGGAIPTLNSRPADDVETTSGETVPDSEFSD